MAKLEIIVDICRVTAELREHFPPSLQAMAGTDAEIDVPQSWDFYEHIAWEAGYATPTGPHSIFIHPSYRGIRLDHDTGVMHPHGPDLAVAYLLRFHRDRLAANSRLAAYVMQALWDEAERLGYHPHVHTMTSGGRPESTDWYCAGVLTCGPITGAPTSGWE